MQKFKSLWMYYGQAEMFTRCRPEISNTEIETPNGIINLYNRIYVNVVELKT